MGGHLMSALFIPNSASVDVEVGEQVLPSGLRMALV